MRLSIAFLAALVATLGAAEARAQSVEPTASLDIHRGLNVSTVRPLRIQLHPEGSSLGLSAIELADGPALVEVTGDANRLYRVQVLDGTPDEASFEIWSANAGDISASRVAVMDADGHDLLRISGEPAAVARLFRAPTAIPLNIQYE